MPRKSRSKPKNSKVNNMNDNLLLIDEHSHDLNGGSSIGDVNSAPLPVNDISKKRQADVYDDANDSNYDEVGPPRKKNYPDKKKGTKRQLSSSEDEEFRKTKAQKIDLNSDDNDDYDDDDDDVISIGEREWKETNISSANCSNAQNLSENSHFIIATYNVLLNKQIKHHVIKSSSKYYSSDKNIGIKHMQLMKELDFLKADILCLQQVNYTYWKNRLERALKERGYISDIVIGDKVSNIGVVTLYRSSRFIKVDIDCNKLSKLCIELIPANNDLDETTLNSIKQYLDEPDSYIITVLKDTQMKDERLLIIGNTHLSSPSIDKQDLRCVQAVGMFWRIHEMITQIKADLINNNSTLDQQHYVSPCWILCGDFNSDPNSPVYQICRDGYPNEKSIRKLQSLRTVRLGTSQNSSSLVDLLWHSFQHPLTDSCSSYGKVVSCELGNDYIWMSEQGLRPSKVLMPCSSEYQQFQSSTSTTSASPTASTAAVTNNNRPFVVSDHLSLACHVSFMT